MDSVVNQNHPQEKAKWLSEGTMQRRALGSIIMNKASRGGGILAELFQILKNDIVKLLHSICQQIWKT